MEEMMFPGQRTEGMKDPIAVKLLTFAQNILAVVFGLLPLVFIPVAAAPFGYTKTFFVVIGVFVALILFGLSVLRSGVIRTVLPWPLIMLWFVAFATAAAALFSGDVRDAFIGNAFEVHTALFVALLALVGSVWMLVGTSKAAIMRLFLVLISSTFVLAVFHVLRLFVDNGALSLSIFSNATTSPIGGWNDLAIFFGLTIILSLVALEQLQLTKWGQALFGIVVLSALIMLAVVNFFAVWVVLGIMSLVVLVWAVSKDRFGSQAASISGVSLSISLAVLVTSIVFIVGGSVVGSAISEKTGISFVEVRPSIVATTDVVKNVFQDNIFFGIGPNKFADAWRLYKDPAINSSIFWNTDFISGFGYLPTFFATTGVTGGVLWILFLAAFVVTGFRTLLRSSESDRVWYFIATASFVAGLYLWGLSIIYVPGPVLLLLAAMCTGLLSAAHLALMRGSVREVKLGGNQRSGFVLVAITLILIVSSVGALYFVGRHYAAVYTFNQATLALQPGVALTELENSTARAFALSADDRFARRVAEFQLARIRSLLQIETPTEDQQIQFRDAVTNGIDAARLATEVDSSDARNWTTLGTIYATLVSTGIEGAFERAEEALLRAAELDPHNPARLYDRAQLAFINGETIRAHELIQEAIRLKPNYGAAIFFLSQIEISLGNLPEAIRAAQAITVLEPQNPVRHYQLGLLLLSNNQPAPAATSFERAVALDQDYSNARYFLAFAYDALNRTEDALEQLEIVRSLNLDNETVVELIAQLNRGERLRTSVSQEEQQPVVDGATITETEGAVSTDTPPDTPLVSPVNVTDDQEFTEAPEDPETDNQQEE